MPVKLIVVLGVLYAVWWLAQNRRRGAALSAAEARAVLDVPANATDAEIAAAHRRMIARVHPDNGGSNALAARVNAARAALLHDPARPPRG